ncbi:MAG: aldo/keto reductase [Sutterella seckii]
MPTIGFGTWQIPINEHFQSAVQTAIQLGYRHFDTAQIYNNAALIGDVIRESGIPRSEFFLTRSGRRTAPSRARRMPTR